MTRIDQLLTVAGLGFSLTLAACGSQDAAGEEAQAAASAETHAGSAAPATGTVIEVKMVTDGAGNYFEPADVEAKPGDVIRFVLVSGVHNVSFPSSLNAGKGTLPEPSSYLQLPGQSFDLTVDLPAGEYGFQCDPHAALGMIGTLTVR